MPETSSSVGIGSSLIISSALIAVSSTSITAVAVET
ncbi:MAG: hypothetical protein ACI90V_004402 [Bacillariaceae sp.]|jgi:hypothetical protein